MDTLFTPQIYLDAFIKTAQYLASLTSQQDWWSEISKTVIHFFGADLAGFAERLADGEVKGRDWIFSDDVSYESVFTGKTKDRINDVLESGFFSVHQIHTPNQYSLLILPIRQENLSTTVLMIGYRMSGPIPKDLLNVYMAVAGLVGITTTELSSKEALRKARDELEIKVAERTEELSQTNIRLKELDRLKNMFIASMSHELRTPLNSIIGFTGIILQGMTGEVTEEQRKQLTIVKNSGIHLLDLINDIIDVNKIEIGQIELSIEEFDLSDVMQKVWDFFKVAADEKGLKWSLEMPERLIIESDERRTKQVVMNLMSNALKFIDGGEIEIMAAEKDGTVEISVRDTGIGIKKENMNMLFKQFSRIPGEGRPIKKGTGLGLYLSKKIADLLDGDIKAESTFGEGSKFTFILPLKYEKAKT